MTESVYVNRDRSKVVEEGSPDAAYRIHTKEAKRLGLLKDAPKGTKVVEPAQEPENGTLTTETVKPRRRSTKTDE